MLPACLQLEIHVCTCRYTGKHWPLCSKSWISNSSLFTHNRWLITWDVYFCMGAHKWIKLYRCLFPWMDIFYVYLLSWFCGIRSSYCWPIRSCWMSVNKDLRIHQILNYWRMLTTSLVQTPSAWTPSSSGSCSATIITWKLHRMSAFSPLVSTKLEATCPDSRRVSVIKSESEIGRVIIITCASLFMLAKKKKNKVVSAKSSIDFNQKIFKFHDDKMCQPVIERKPLLIVPLLLAIIHTSFYNIVISKKESQHIQWTFQHYLTAGFHGGGHFWKRSTLHKKFSPKNGMGKFLRMGTFSKN